MSPNSLKLVRTISQINNFAQLTTQKLAILKLIEAHVDKTEGLPHALIG
jgi:hypothetical protein